MSCTPSLGCYGEECDADCEAVRVILSNITAITIQQCMYSSTLSLGQNSRSLRQHLAL
jgi:hypothetical protein